MLPVEEDVRVPFYIRGPGIPRGIVSDYQVSEVWWLLLTDRQTTEHEAMHADRVQIICLNLAPWVPQHATLLSPLLTMSVFKYLPSCN